MSGQWKPGQVAMVTGRWTFDKPHFDSLGVRRGCWWSSLLGDGGIEDHLVSAVRPFVVIDPEDREQVERLAQTFAEHMGVRMGFRVDHHEVSNLADALREFANPTPPKPDEPMGLGAVVEVESAHDYMRKAKRRLVRGHATDQPWMGDNLKRNWAEIDGPITVLSEGVTQ